MAIEQVGLRGEVGPTGEEADDVRGARGDKTGCREAAGELFVDLAGAWIGIAGVEEQAEVASGRVLGAIL